MAKFETNKFAGTVGGAARYGFKILSPFNDKTPKGEKRGYATAILYLAPHTLVATKSLCPHSTPACREGCLYTAGRGAFAQVMEARERRTRMFVERTEAFMMELLDEIGNLQERATRAGLKLAIRLNGTSDVRWENVTYQGRTVFDAFPEATFYDYTRFPVRHRHVPKNWHLTFSLADAPIYEAIEHLEAGRSVAVVTTDERLERKVRLEKPDERGGLDFLRFTVVDGEKDDLRFLDPSPAIVMLKPKGRLRRGGPMVRIDFLDSLAAVYEVWTEEIA